MKSKDFSTTILVNQTADEVFDSIIHVKVWWHGKIQGQSKKVGDEFSYRFKDYHFSHQKVTKLIPGKKLVWLVTESNLPPFKHKSEWTNTKLIFELNPKGDQTELRFTHEGLTHDLECWDDCSQGWTLLIQESLLNLIQTGKGKEVFN